MTYEERTKFLRENTNLTTLQVSNLLYISEEAIRRQCKKEKIKLRSGYPLGVWHMSSDEERIKLIRNFKAKKTCANIARSMGCTEETVINFCIKHEIKTETKAVTKRRRHPNDNVDVINPLMARALSSPRLGL